MGSKGVLTYPTYVPMLCEGGCRRVLRIGYQGVGHPEYTAPLKFQRL